MTDPEETDQEYSERMHRENMTHDYDNAEFANDPHDEDYDEDGVEDCPHCQGTGWVSGHGSNILTECDECMGDGVI